jgi:hypothetical protein
LTVDLATAIAVGSIVFAAGGVYVTGRRTSASAVSQGRRIGKLVEKVAHLEGMMRGRRVTLPQGQPKTPEGDDDDS